MPKAIFIICDGLGDLPMNGRTPLSAARKPNFDALAKGGQCGLLHTIGVGITPGSDTAHLALFGYDPCEYYNGRGTFEALGAGMAMKHGDVAFRANFSTVDASHRILDRRAGRLKDATPLEAALRAIKLPDCTLDFRSTVEHRGVLVLSGPGLSSNISDTDPHETGRQILRCEPLDKTPEAAHTALLVNEFTRRALSVLKRHPFNLKLEKAHAKPANALLLRGPGSYVKVEGIEKKYGLKAACIAGGALYKGVARYVGIAVPFVKGATGRADTDLHAKAKAALAALPSRDIVFIHVKATDSFGHDGDFAGKRSMIERIDGMVGQLRKAAPDAYIILTGDHTTSVVLKHHSFEPVPILLNGPNVRTDTVQRFDEMNCAAGSLGHLTGLELFRIVAGLAGKGKIYGS
ncbi:MAG: 2,3-bisphosphoglycerate-independent phosphoglycerate mutase [Candidatus Burarchaeum sp.]|nr:2,3-bisphosphoglycerate-independent phosphoglycerate mutase [Candidatus Burarchaeum sp.]MDO8339233.1 2,3-bisphosphoglycerate-independent phosphoglycerate mutase [Candidatus Burarchaeum sp.]